MIVRIQQPFLEDLGALFAMVSLVISCCNILMLILITMVEEKKAIILLFSLVVCDY